jgi:frataxin-like iron-binding protein CyaY
MSICSADFIHPLSCKKPFTFPRHFIRPLGIKIDIDMDMETDKDTDTDADMDTDKKTDMEMCTDTEMDMDTDLEFEYFCIILIRRHSPYSSIWITCDISQRHPQTL